MKTAITLAAAALLLLGTASAASARGNPFVTDIYTADPDAFVHDGRLYVATGHDEAPVGTFNFFMRDWHMFSSTDGRRFEAHGPRLALGDFDWAYLNAWAGQIVERDGKFYWYVSVDDRPSVNPSNWMTVGVAVADSPLGPYRDALGHALIDNRVPNNSALDIDPTVFVDDDGQAYLYWGSFSAPRAAKLKSNMTELDGPVITPQGLEAFWEAPYLFKRDGIYYLAYARRNPVTGGNPATIDYATAPGPLGPWTHRGRILDTVPNTTTNHPAIVEFKGQWYVVYHNGMAPSGGEFRRSVSIDKLHFNPDGTIEKVVQTLSAEARRPVASYRFDESGADSSGNGHDATPAGGAAHVASPFGNALSLDGSGQHARLPAGIVQSMYDFTVASWVKLDDTAGSPHIFDFGTAGTATGPRVPGKLGNAVRLNGSGEYVSLPRGIVSGLSDFTISTWVNPAALTTWSRIFDFGTGTQTNMFLTVNAGGGPRFAITTGGGGAEQRLSSGEPLPTDAWSLVTITLEGTTGRMYVNGRLVATNPGMTLNPSSLGETGNNWIGRSQYPDPFLNATVDDFQIYDRALSAADVEALAAGQQGAGNVASYRFDEEGGKTAVDSSGNGRDATIESSPVHMYLTPESDAGTARFAISTGATTQRIDGDAPLPTGEWTHVAVAKSGLVGTLYVNGRPVGQNTRMTLYPARLGNTPDNWIGRSANPGDAYLSGQVDDFRIYQRGLGAADLEQVQLLAGRKLGTGFWRSRDGQRVVADGPSSGGVCVVGTWLRDFAPFQDLSPAAGCAEVAAYVRDAIEAATCAGTTCNSMLKAQMLATALNWYFPTPIGGDPVDVTSAPEAFGGASTLTVPQLLEHAAGRSNAGGSNWYGNDKETQEQAKDVFEALNRSASSA